MLSVFIGSQDFQFFSVRFLTIEVLFTHIDLSVEWVEVIPTDKICQETG